MPALHARQTAPAAPTPTPTDAFIPTAYGDLDSSLPPGVVVGIVLGSIAGALLLLYLLYTALGCGPALVLTRTTTHDLSSSSAREQAEVEPAQQSPQECRPEEEQEVQLGLGLSLAEQTPTYGTRYTAGNSILRRVPAVFCSWMKAAIWHRQSSW
ncbi:hypothetical protein H634G_04490 [Metarhizium anisopliae BRIP 53293]|uniref:Uncharacterized protein n=1 Tax=Metarhizium anisopliae BRIP 53293 TaxID=1291518 RepID=A0A0D9P2D6_METAN|nr:hypothetical protein H634G_04490 [Metarhizium anisopliae BRIP 53293]